MRELFVTGEASRHAASLGGQAKSMASVKFSRSFLRASGQSAFPCDKCSSTQRVAVVQRLDATARSFHAFWVIAAGEVYFSELYSRCRRAGKPWYAVQSTGIRFRTLSQREDGREQSARAAALDCSLRAVRGAYLFSGDDKPRWRGFGRKSL